MGSGYVHSVDRSGTAGLGRGVTLTAVSDAARANVDPAEVDPAQVDTAQVENSAALALTSFCWWRADLPREVCEAYWRDVHGPMFARVAGLWQYRQLRLAANRADLWPSVPGLSFDVPVAAQPQGIPHGLFVSEDDLRAFGEHPLPRRAIPDDARNFVGRIGALLVAGGAGRTLVDRLGEPVVQGAPRVPTFAVCVVARPAVEPADVHGAIVDVAGAWSRVPGVLRVRVEPLPRYEQEAMASPGVPWEWPADASYAGWVEVAVRERAVVTELAAALAGVADRVAAVHTYPVREVYTLIAAGRPTDVGLRGFPAARLIGEVGADNQRDEGVLSLLFGDAVRGLERLRRPG